MQAETETIDSKESLGFYWPKLMPFCQLKTASLIIFDTINNDFSGHVIQDVPHDYSTSAGSRTFCPTSVLHLLLIINVNVVDIVMFFRYALPKLFLRKTWNFPSIVGIINCKWSGTDTTLLAVCIHKIPIRQNPSCQSSSYAFVSEPQWFGTIMWSTSDTWQTVMDGRFIQSKAKYFFEGFRLIPNRIRLF